MMEQNTEPEHNLMKNFEFVFTSYTTQSSLPSAEIHLPILQDLYLPDMSCDTNVTDANMVSDSNQSFNDILDSLKDMEQLYPGPLLDYLNGDLDIFSSIESNEMTQSIRSAEECSPMIKTSNSVLPVLRSPVEKAAKGPSDQSISLSKSVAVTDSTPNQLQLPYLLETTYRPRYKSDYFPQNGNVRRPRYVADNQGNHFVTLQMPSGYTRDLNYEYVRVALITIANDEHEHYYSPYKFQVNHDDAKVPDQNPMYLPVQLLEGTDSMKILLVLIKSKLDQLYDAQPLKLFSDKISSIQNIINDEKLASKDLINKYQLDKSHIAFTLCTKLPDGSYDIHSETTIVSSVITESASKSPVAVAVAPNRKQNVAKASPAKTVSCPNCKHCFDPNSIPVTEERTKRKASNPSSRTVTKAKITNQVNKKKKNA